MCSCFSQNPLSSFRIRAEYPIPLRLSFSCPGLPHSQNSPFFHSLEVILCFQAGSGTKYTIECISENPLLHLGCTYRHSAPHLVPRNLVFFNNDHTSFPSRAMSSSFVSLHLRILLSCFSNTCAHAWGDPALCPGLGQGAASGRPVSARELWSTELRGGELRGGLLRR